MSLLDNGLVSYSLTECDKTSRDVNNMSVAQRCGCALAFLPKAKPVLSRYLERIVFTCYSAVGTECESVNCVTFG